MTPEAGNPPPAHRHVWVGQRVAKLGPLLRWHALDAQAWSRARGRQYRHRADGWGNGAVSGACGGEQDTAGGFQDKGRSCRTRWGHSWIAGG